MTHALVFTVVQRGARFHVLRNGEPVGARDGYSTRAIANVAIAQIKRWDAIAPTHPRTKP